MSLLKERKTIEVEREKAIPKQERESDCGGRERERERDQLWR